MSFPPFSLLEEGKENEGHGVAAKEEGLGERSGEVRPVWTCPSSAIDLSCRLASGQIDTSLGNKWSQPVLAPVIELKFHDFQVN